MTKVPILWTLIPFNFQDEEENLDCGRAEGEEERKAA